MHFLKKKNHFDQNLIGIWESNFDLKVTLSLINWFIYYHSDVTLPRSCYLKRVQFLFESYTFTG